MAGLNPHAGEGGLFGQEEKKIIKPAVDEARKHGINVRGPISPDAIFNLANGGLFDLVIAMYHDQGLIPLKLLSFNRSVNVTVGLPFVRTSVDHGTGFDIAGKGMANPQSLIEAIKVAAHFSRLNDPTTLAQITQELLAAYNRYPSKNLGQHFLVDPKVVGRISRAAQLNKNDLVIEIGSGLGVVTAELAREVYHLIAVEIDKELPKISQEVLKDLRQHQFCRRGYLENNLEELTLGRKYKVVGNLPYYITAPIIELLLDAEEKPERAVIMVQKEVAERMAAAPGTKQYGSFSIFCHFTRRWSLIHSFPNLLFTPGRKSVRRS